MVAKPEGDALIHTAEIRVVRRELMREKRLSVSAVLDGGIGRRERAHLGSLEFGLPEERHVCGRWEQSDCAKGRVAM